MAPYVGVYRWSNLPTIIAAAQPIVNHHHFFSAFQPFFELLLVVSYLLYRPLQYRKYRSIVRIHGIHYDVPCCLIVDLCILNGLLSSQTNFRSLLQASLVLQLVVRGWRTLYRSYRRSASFGMLSRCVWFPIWVLLSLITHFRSLIECSPYFHLVVFCCHSLYCSYLPLAIYCCIRYLIALRLFANLRIWEWLLCPFSNSHSLSISLIPFSLILCLFFYSMIPSIGCSPPVYPYSANGRCEIYLPASTI